MKFLEVFTRQPKLWLLLEAFAALFVVALVDAKTPWQFSLFVFYAAPIFLVAFSLGQRAGISFAIVSTAVSWYANLNTQPFNDLTGYGWSNINRLSAFLFVAICGASIKNFREEARKKVEALEHAQMLEHEIVRVGDREQMRIGQDLHDGVCQSLAALDCATECLKVELENGGLQAQAVTARQIQKLMQETTVEARNLARGLVPVALEPDGLVTALRDLVTTTVVMRHADIDFRSEGEIQIKDPDVATHLYRIAQEALSNAMRHANATHVSVSVVRDSSAIHVAVEDDGRGTSRQPRPDGMGWRTMRYRAKLIGATIAVESGVTGGTIVRCSLPVAVALASS